MGLTALPGLFSQREGTKRCFGGADRNPGQHRSEKEANNVFSSWIRFAFAVAGRLFYVPRHGVLYPHSLDTGRSFNRLPFH
jgi:hypothetical protein